MARRGRKASPISPAVVAGLLLSVLGVAAAAPSWADDDKAEACLKGTSAVELVNIGSPFGDRPVALRWTVDVPAGCDAVTVEINGEPAARSGWKLVRPDPVGSDTTYRMTAWYGPKPDEKGRNLGLTTALRGRVVTYARRGAAVVEEPGGPGVEVAEDVAHTILGTVSEAVRREIRKILEIHVIPVGVNLTDLPPFASLRGRTTCADESEGGSPAAKRPGCVADRRYDDLRGVYFGLVPGRNTLAVAVGVEDLVKRPDVEGEVPGYTLAHELAHGVLLAGAPSSQPTLEAMLSKQKARGDFIGDDAYTSSNVHEYFAESTAALFGFAPLAVFREEYSDVTLGEYDPDMLALLRTVYVHGSEWKMGA